MVSTHNPFRTPAVAPTPTGASGSSAQNPPATSPRPQDTETRSNNPPSQPSNTSVNDILTEELPPAYTPAPNFYEGEATLELGPRRPFQQAPAPPPNPSHFPPPSWGVPPQQTNNWSAFPGHSHRQQFTGGHPPPPVHPSLAGAPRPTSTPPIQPASDFARDFYSAGSGDSGLYGGGSSQYGPGASSSSGPSYAPPPGEPPSHSSGKSPASPDSPPSNGVTDDGRPTDRPVPGHPLLRHGKVLVYPQGYECQKCRNTGYKNFDPSHPCSRCWDKYARPYSGAITYASWTTPSDGPNSSSSTSSSTFQRPLPVFRAPQAALHQQSASWSGPASNLSRAATTSRVTGAYPGASVRVIPVAGGGLPMGSYLDRLGVGASGRSGFPPPAWQHGGPPGNTVVYSAGDPRLGGRLCWRCGGRGKTSFLIFEEETCGICNGLGRTFV